MSHATLKNKLAEYLVITTSMPIHAAEELLDAIDQRLKANCVYCDKPLGNDDSIDLRGSMPIHADCNEQLGRELDAEHQLPPWQEEW
jgi:hypothetical protein